MGSSVLSCGELTEGDLYEALRELSGYVDVTPGDLRKIYELAWHHAVNRLQHSVQLKDVMTRDVAAVLREASLLEAAEAMAARCVSGLPVVEPDGTVVGVISERDLLPRLSGCHRPSAMAVIAAALKEGGAVGIPFGHGRVADLMAAPPVTVREETTLGEALALLSTHGINRLPVVDDDGKLVGIVSRGDLLAVSQAGEPA